MNEMFAFAVGCLFHDKMINFGGVSKLDISALNKSRQNGFLIEDLVDRDSTSIDLWQLIFIGLSQIDVFACFAPQQFHSNLF